MDEKPGLEIGANARVAPRGFEDFFLALQEVRDLVEGLGLHALRDALNTRQAGQRAAIAATPVGSKQTLPETAAHDRAVERQLRDLGLAIVERLSSVVDPVV